MNSPSKPMREDASQLRFIQPHDTKRNLKARRPQRTAKLFRFILPGIALCVLIALVLWPVLDPHKVKSVVMKNIPDLVIQNLHFTGLDSKNEPYSMAAIRATRPSGVQNIYDLVKPEAEITLANGAWVAGKALYGRYDQDHRKLWLGGNVQLFHDKGYQFTTDEAQVDLNEDTAWGEKPILIQGDFGEIRGQGFQLLDSGHIMVVKGPAQATLNLHANSSSDKEDAGKASSSLP